MPNKRAIVIYDTKYGSTEQVAHWIAEGLNDADLKYVGDVTSVYYDLVVIGSPIYGDALSQKILQFLDKNKENLANKKIALFTVSMPLNMTPDRAKRFTGASTLKGLSGRVRGEVIDSRAFLGRIETKDMTALDRLSLHIQYLLKGYKLKDVDFMNRDDASAWGRKLINILNESGTSIGEERRGRRAGSSAPPHSTEVKGNGDRQEDKKK
ncbi:MAG TPA: flavodoxin domain-containing protein [Methanocellaceae archaeon]|jgi:menaquinone-dependent protoporphyrinogen oxidase